MFCKHSNVAGHSAVNDVISAISIAPFLEECPVGSLGELLMERGSEQIHDSDKQPRYATILLHKICRNNHFTPFAAHPEQLIQSLLRSVQQMDDVGSHHLVERFIRIVKLQDISLFYLYIIYYRTPIF